MNQEERHPGDLDEVTNRSRMRATFGKSGALASLPLKPEMKYELLTPESQPVACWNARPAWTIAIPRTLCIRFGSTAVSLVKSSRHGPARATPRAI